MESVGGSEWGGVGFKGPAEANVVTCHFEIGWQMLCLHVGKEQTLQKGDSSYDHSSKGCFGSFDSLYLLPAPNLRQQ